MHLVIGLWYGAYGVPHHKGIHWYLGHQWVALRGELPEERKEAPSVGVWADLKGEK